MVMIRLMQPILFWKDIIFVTRKILIIEYKNALKCCPAAMLPNLLCTCSTEYRLYNVLVWSEKMNTIQFFPIRSKIKHLQYYLFMYFENNIRSFCILFFFLVRIIMGPDRPILPIDDVVMFLLLKETGACCSVIQL